MRTESDVSSIFDELAEQSLLGAVMIGGHSTFERCSVIGAGDFFYPRHGYIWDAMGELVARGMEIDNVTLAHELTRAGKFRDAGGDVYLIALMTVVPYARDIEDYVEIVKHKSVVRQLIRIGRDMAENALAGTHTPAELLSNAGELLESVRLPQNTPKFIDVLQSYVNERGQMWKTGADESVVKWGYPFLDRVIAPLKRGEMSMIAGVTNSGKSALVANFILKWLWAGVPVGLISLEMNTHEVLDRLTAIGTLIDFNKAIANPQRDINQWGKMMDFWQDLGDRGFYISDTPIDMATLPSLLREWKDTSPDKQGIRVLVVDYAGLITPSDVDRRASFYEKMSSISNGLKQLAMKTGISILTVAQINRDGFNRPPSLDYISGSIRFPQDSSTVLAIHPVKDGFDGETTLYHLKSRHAPCGQEITMKRVGLKFHEIQRSEPNSF